MPPIHWDTIITGLVSAALFWGIRRLTSMLKGYVDHSYEWREATGKKLDEQDKKLDALTDATQTTMRTEILHYCNKFLERGWVTPEERASIDDMYTKYSSLNANGLIKGYMRKLDQLPDRELG